MSGIFLAPNAILLRWRRTNSEDVYHKMLLRFNTSNLKPQKFMISLPFRRSVVQYAGEDWKNVGVFLKNVGDFLENDGVFSKNVGVFFWTTKVYSKKPRTIEQATWSIPLQNFARITSPLESLARKHESPLKKCCIPLSSRGRAHAHHCNLCLFAFTTFTDFLITLFVSSRNKHFLDIF